MTCRVVSDSLEGVYSADKKCVICNDLEVDCIFPACRHIVACQRCMLQVQQSAADAIKPPISMESTPGFLFMKDQNAKVLGFTDPVGVHRQLKGIYGCLCKLMFPDAMEWDSPWSPWSEVSKKLSKDAHDYHELRDFVGKHESVIHVFQGGPGSFERLTQLTSKSAGVFQTVKAMTTTLSEKIAHLETDLKLLTLQTIAGEKLHRPTLLKILKGISSIPSTKGGETGYGPTVSQVNSLIDDIAQKDGTWPVYGTADNLIAFLMSSYKLADQAKSVFTEFDESYDVDPDRPTAGKSLRKVKESLMKCLKGTHTGRDYATNVIFPLVRLLHFRYGTYGMPFFFLSFLASFRLRANVSTAL